jgi:hypothetical protein
MTKENAKDYLPLVLPGHATGAGDICICDPLEQYPCHCSQQANMQCPACNHEGRLVRLIRLDMNRLTDYTSGGEWTAAKMVCAIMQNRFRLLERNRR